MNLNIRKHHIKSWGFAWRMALWLLCTAPVVTLWLGLSAIEAAAAGWEAFFDSVRGNTREIRRALTDAVRDLAQIFGQSDRPRGDTDLSNERDPVS